MSRIIVRGGNMSAGTYDPTTLDMRWRQRSPTLGMRSSAERLMTGPVCPVATEPMNGTPLRLAAFGAPRFVA